MTSDGAPGASGGAGMRKARMALVLLMLASFFSFLDRQILTLLVVPIERELGIGDLEIGLLQGLSFSIFFSVMAMPLGYLVDRYQRWRVLGLGILAWSLATLASGFAANFHQLLLCRMAVGFGEASLMPAAYSLLADYFAPGQRGRAFGAFSIGSYAGGGGSLLLGGLLLTRIGAEPNMELPLLGTVAVWRGMFVIVGLPGLIVAAVALTRRDPPRALPAGSEPADGMRFLVYLRRHAGVFAGVWGAYAALAYVTYTFLPWAPVDLARRFAMSPGKVGLTFGLIQLVIGIAGALVAGSLADRWTREARTGAKFRLTLFMWLGGWPALALIAFGNSPVLALIGIALFILCNTISYVSSAAAVQDMVPASLRGRTTAFWYLVNGIVGIGGGPLATAWFNVRIAPADGGLGLAMLLAAAPALMMGLFATMLTVRAYDRLRLQLAGDRRG